MGLNTQQPSRGDSLRLDLEPGESPPASDQVRPDCQRVRDAR
jgi:hypothetical protein